MKRKITLGLVQMDCVMMNKKKNLEKIVGYIEEAHRQGISFLCFPELCTTGYSPEIIGSRYLELSEEAKGETFDLLRKKAVQYQMYLAVPMALKSRIPGVLYNGLIIIDNQGELMGTYNKTHLWAGERYWFRAGNEYPVFETEFGKIGMMICYDGGFPEVSRILALKGAELILCPSAFPIHDKDMWDIYFQTRALENGCFVAGINRVGQEGNCHMFGNNKIYNPRGKLIAQAPVDEEALLRVTLDLEETADYREKEVVYLKDRRIDTYQELLKCY